MTQPPMMDHQFEGEPPRSGLGTVGKVVLAIFGVVVLAALYGGYQAYKFYEREIQPTLTSIANGDSIVTDPQKIKALLPTLGRIKVKAPYQPLFGVHLKIMGAGMTTVAFGPEAARPKWKGDKKNERPEVDASLHSIIWVARLHVPDVNMKAENINSREFLPKGKVLETRTQKFKVGKKMVAGKRYKILTEQGLNVAYSVQPSPLVTINAAGPWGKFDREVYLHLLRNYRAPKGTAASH